MDSILLRHGAEHFLDLSEDQLHLNDETPLCFIFPVCHPTYRASSWRSGSAQWPWSRVWWGPGVSHASQHCWCFSEHLRERSCAPWCLQRKKNMFYTKTCIMQLLGNEYQEYYVSSGNTEINSVHLDLEDSRDYRDRGQPLSHSQKTSVGLRD